MRALFLIVLFGILLVVGPMLVTSALGAPVADLDVAPQKKGPMSLVQIVTNLEKAGYAPIVEISLDDRVWEVEAYKGDRAFELDIHPVSGKILSEHKDKGDPRPPTDAQPLSNMLKQLEKAGYTEVDEVSFERDSWEVELVRNRQERELRVDPRDGKILSDRVDD